MGAVARGLFGSPVSQEDGDGRAREREGGEREGDGASQWARAGRAADVVAELRQRLMEREQQLAEVGTV